MGPPDEAVADDIFDLAQYHDPAWAVGYGDALYVDANYLLLCENLCDPSHVVYVHPTTLGNPGENSEKVPANRPTGASTRRAGPSMASRSRSTRRSETSPARSTAGNST